jgi:hypothetical protein
MDSNNEEEDDDDDDDDDTTPIPQISNNSQLCEDSFENVKLQTAGYIYY